MKTFDHYLDVKAKSIAVRTNSHLSTIKIVSTLQEMARRAWLLRSGGSISYIDFLNNHPSYIGAGEVENLLSIMEQEGLVEFQELPLSSDKTLRIVFDELQDYLLLKALISDLPENIRGRGVFENVAGLFEYFQQEKDNPAMTHIASLLGMALPEDGTRSDFLQRLFEWDFQAFCLCLSRIPPVDTANRCDLPSLHEFADKLCDWYEAILARYFRTIQPHVDPWGMLEGDSVSLSIELKAEDTCREISYNYRLSEGTVRINSITKTLDYPTWNLTWGDIRLHNPGGGMIVPVFRMPGSKEVTRSLNFSWLSPYPGISVNLPERLALSNVLQEIDYLIAQDTLPCKSSILVREEAQNIAYSLFSSRQRKNLTIEKIQAYTPSLLSQYEVNSDNYIEIEGKLNRLCMLLNIFPNALKQSLLPKPDIKKVELNHTSFSDDRLIAYIRTLLLSALQAYIAITDGNFPEMSELLNTKLLFPCSILAVTDRKNIRFAFAPVDNTSDIKVLVMILNERLSRVNDMSAKFQMNGIELHDYTFSMMEKRGLSNRIVYPLD